MNIGGLRSIANLGGVGLTSDIAYGGDSFMCESTGADTDGCTIRDVLVFFGKLPTESRQDLIDPLPGEFVVVEAYDGYKEVSVDAQISVVGGECTVTTLEEGEICSDACLRFRLGVRRCNVKANPKENPAPARR